MKDPIVEHTSSTLPSLSVVQRNTVSTPWASTVVVFGETNVLTHAFAPASSLIDPLSATTEVPSPTEDWSVGEAAPAMHALSAALASTTSPVGHWLRHRDAEAEDEDFAERHASHCVAAGPLQLLEGSQRALQKKHRSPSLSRYFPDEQVTLAVHNFAAFGTFPEGHEATHVSPSMLLAQETHLVGPFPVHPPLAAHWVSQSVHTGAPLAMSAYCPVGQLDATHSFVLVSSYLPAGHADAHAAPSFTRLHALHLDGPPPTHPTLLSHCPLQARQEGGLEKLSVNVPTGQLERHVPLSLTEAQLRHSLGPYAPQPVASHCASHFWHALLSASL